jgi:sodium-dependent dicarboxylate transporter 2/3/5
MKTMPTVLIVDDEDRFRASLARRLKMRGYDTLDVDNGEDGIKLIRSHNEIDVVILDRKMPKLMGEQALEEMKAFRPELQVIMLTGHGSMESAMKSGRLEAYAYLQKPCGLDDLIEVIDAARRDKITLMQRHEIPQVEKGSAWRWLLGSHNSRPGVALLGLLLFFTMVMLPPPQRLLELVSSEKTGRLSDPHVGYASYAKMQTGESIATYYGRSYRLGKAVVDEHGRKVIEPLTALQAASKAKVMLGVLLVAALFWATGAIPVGVTAILVGVLMYFMRVLPPDDIAKAYAKDAVGRSARPGSIDVSDCCFSALPRA